MVQQGKGLYTKQPATYLSTTLITGYIRYLQQGKTKTNVKNK